MHSPPALGCCRGISTHGSTSARRADLYLPAPAGTRWPRRPGGFRRIGRRIQDWGRTKLPPLLTRRVQLARDYWLGSHLSSGSRTWLGSSKT
ncbi:MAG: hypothetical protein U0514_00595 [Candidatus Andersenbacteria bacterium]